MEKPKKMFLSGKCITYLKSKFYYIGLPDSEIPGWILPIQRHLIQMCSTDTHTHTHTKISYLYL